MILFIVLLVLSVVIGVITLLSAVIAGGGFLLAFGDIIIFGWIIWMIIKKIIDRKK